MRILLSHNSYQQPGGEDAVFAAELALLREKGFEVLSHTLHNRALEAMPRPIAALRTLWNSELYGRLRGLIQEFRPEVVHLHNTFPLASPAAVYAAKAEGVPVVMTLHNYRLICSNALLFRAGRVCEDCVGRLPLPGVVHGCYRGRSGSAVVAAMLALHRGLGTWEKVDLFVALTDFSRRKFVQGGLPEERIAVKPNFVHPDPGTGNGHRAYGLFVGRLSPEKGGLTLLRAWRNLQLPLRILGDGPLKEMVTAVVSGERRFDHVEVLGRCHREDVLGNMRSARFLVFPSEWYESCPMTIAEAFACGAPVIASRLGAMAEIVEDGRTGLLFEPGNADDLAAKVEWAWAHPQEMAEMGREARREYELKYTAERNYQMLMDIYQSAIERARGKPD